MDRHPTDLPYPPSTQAEPPGAAAEDSVLAVRPGVFDLRRPARQALPLVLASPHSGREYPSWFLALTSLDLADLRRSEDCFIDEIFRPAADRGAPLLSALFPRAFLDPNREPFELDPAMFQGTLPPYVNSRSARVQAGLGTIARIVAGGQSIYDAKLDFREATARLDTYYYPYHAALRRLVDGTVAAFGHCILLDCHSMPSIGLPPEARAGAEIDIVLGDCHGSACAPAVIATAEMVLRQQGYSVARNAPYAGGYTTRHYGRPGDGVHALQIEINRRLYMEEVSFSRRPDLPLLAEHMVELVEALGGVRPRRPGPAAAGR
ncbi:MAG: hypothetical protein RLY86_556 [Pseudomonadota bacterium]|jgi:N-formylglutamate amidohydrolase